MTDHRELQLRWLYHLYLLSWICIKLLFLPHETFTSRGIWAPARKRTDVAPGPKDAWPLTPRRIKPATGHVSPLSHSLKSTGIFSSHISHWNDHFTLTFLNRVCCQATLMLFSFWQVAIYSLQTLFPVTSGPWTAPTVTIQTAYLFILYVHISMRHKVILTYSYVSLLHMWL